MHLLMIIWALLLAFLLRLIPQPVDHNFQNRWYHVLLLFILPPLFLLMTILAVLSMGFQGEMLGVKIIWLGNCLALIFFIFILLYALRLIYQNIITQQIINNYPEQIIQTRKVRILPTDFPYCAQVGIFRPQLLVSQGLLDILDTEHLEAVLLHEEAHQFYHDSFWFFCFNWLKDFSFWLPKTDSLWQDLLLLREIRADGKAAKEISPLIVAESLLAVAKSSVSSPFELATPFSIPTPINRLNIRIEALFQPQPSFINHYYHYWFWFFFILTPWITVLLHD